MSSYMDLSGDAFVPKTASLFVAFRMAKCVAETSLLRVANTMAVTVATASSITH